jgi:hypothetical protein
MRTAIFIAAGLFLGLSVTVANAIVIKDANFFDSIPHTLIDFETDGLGYPIVLGQGACQDFYGPDEYAAQGVVFDQILSWTNDMNADFDAAQAIGGSPDISIPSPSQDEFIMYFTNPVRAFGFWVINNNTVETVPVFTAKNAGGEVLETVTFEGDIIDGNTGVADYGFMGIYAGEDIASVEITKDATDFDNLMFSDIPEPASMALLAVGGLALLRRKKLL